MEVRQGEEEWIAEERLIISVYYLSFINYIYFIPESINIQPQMSSRTKELLKGQARECRIAKMEKVCGRVKAHMKVG
jgi:hypothetical protein